MSDPSHRLHIVVPGSEIPKWFMYQNEGSSITITRPSYLYNTNKVKRCGFHPVYVHKVEEFDQTTKQWTHFTSYDLNESHQNFVGSKMEVATTSKRSLAENAVAASGSGCCDDDDEPPPKRFKQLKCRVKPGVTVKGHYSHFTIKERSGGKTEITFELRTVENLRKSIKGKMALFTYTIHALASTLKFAQQVFGAVAGEGNLGVYPERGRAIFQNMGAIQWATLEVSTSWSRSLRNTRRIKGVNVVHIGESTSGIKEVKEMVEGLARQIASLSTAKSTEPHDHDSYSDQANAIGVMRKPSNYNPYSNTYNLGWRDHPNFSWSQGFQQNGPTAPAPQIPQVPQASQPPFRPYNQNQNYSQPRPWEDAFQNFKNVTHSMIEQQNRTIDGL
ncbi:hypothetical protein WN943_015494 [Citrus x changshan-huyou]